jgi:uncharacterized protein YndB with AHSA1/START domain
MRNITETVFIAQPIATLFAAAADPQVQLKWDAPTLRHVEKLTPGPLARGARYRGNFKGMGVVTYEFSEFEPGRSFQHVARMPLGEMRHRFTFEEAAGGTRLTQHGELRPNLVGRLLAPFMMTMLRKRFRTIADELDAYLAAAPGAA